MHKLEITRISLAVFCALPLAAGAQQGLQLKSQPSLMLIPPSLNEEVPLFLEADLLQGHNDKETEAEGNARLRKRGQAVHADRLRYDKPQDEVTAEGKVRIEQRNDVVEGARLKFNLETERGFMDNPSFTLHKTPNLSGQRPAYRDTDARGTAERLLFEGPGHYRAERAQYTTCGPDRDDWYVRAGELNIDKNRDIGTARDASIVFQGVPIFYSPYLSFSLHQERKSGFLTPHYGNTTKGGTELSVPFYWNIAPNRDATISPRVMSKRGTLLLTEFRYLEPSYFGESRVEILPDDHERNGKDRHAFFIRHNHTLPGGWYGTLNLQGVSDDNYFTDLSTQIALASQVLLPREGVLGRNGTWGDGTYTFKGMVQRWQTLQTDPLVPVTAPYNRVPQLTLDASRQDVLHSDLDLHAQYVGFDHPSSSRVSGRRAMAYPSLSLPLQTSYAYLTPKLGLNFTRYDIDPSKSFDSQTRTLPILSADAGLVFERPTQLLGGSLLQTLEPRLYYVYIPYRDQSRIPVFDSGSQDINFATIYSENQFAGWDRINDANQMTVGVSSRFLQADSGMERVRVGVAQRFYFDTQRVTLQGVPGVPDVPVRTSTSSELLAAISGTITHAWTAEAGAQYNTSSSLMQKFNIGTRYQPAPGKVLNVSYRETINPLNPVRQTDVSTQWPVGQGWTGLARWNYSLREKRTLEGLVGVEYNGDCWALRVVAHRFAISTQQTSTTFFVQLELNGISRIGSNPLETLKRNIGGYARTDPRAQQEELRTPYY